MLHLSLTMKIAKSRKKSEALPLDLLLSTAETSVAAESRGGCTYPVGVPLAQMKATYPSSQKGFLPIKSGLETREAKGYEQGVCTSTLTKKLSCLAKLRLRRSPGMKLQHTHETCHSHTLAVARHQPKLPHKHPDCFDTSHRRNHTMLWKRNHDGNKPYEQLTTGKNCVDAESGSSVLIMGNWQNHSNKTRFLVGNF